jgi:hypothetical protein
VTAAIKTDMYERSPNRGGDFSGGNSLLHGADWIFEYQKTGRKDYVYDTANGEWAKEKPHAKTLGKIARVTLMKAALEASRYHTIEYPIKFGRKPSGVWLEKEIIDKLLEYGLITQKASWLAWEDSLLTELQTKFPEIEKQVQGFHKMLQYLEANLALRDYLYPKVLAFSKAMLVGE